MKAIDEHVSVIVGHVAGCDCGRCADARIEARAAHGGRMVVELFGLEAEWAVAVIATAAEEATAIGAGQIGAMLVSSSRFTSPWVGSEAQGTETLTRREARTAQMIAEGMSRSQIAEHMGMSVKTFDTHRGHVMRKMRCANEVQLVRLAVLNGWVQL